MKCPWWVFIGAATYGLLFSALTVHTHEMFVSGATLGFVVSWALANDNGS